jgi:hypothetical protein
MSQVILHRPGRAVDRDGSSATSRTGATDEAARGESFELKFKPRTISDY